MKLKLNASLSAGGGAVLPSLSQLGTTNWMVRQAAVGNRGTAAASTQRTVSEVNNIGRTWGRIDAIPAAGGSWGYRAFASSGDSDIGTIGATASNQATVIPLPATRTLLTDARRPVVQIYYRVNSGANWIVASAPKTVTLTPQTATLGASDWTIEGYLIGDSLAGVRVPRTGVLETVEAAWWTTEADPVDPVQHPTKWTPCAMSSLEPGDGYILLSGLEDNPGASLTGVRLLVRLPGTKVSGVSDAKNVTLPNATGAFDGTMVSLVDAQVTTGDAVDLIITGQPATVNDIVAYIIEWSTDGTTWIDQTSVEPVADTYRRTTAGAIRARIAPFTAAGRGPWFTLGPVSPTVGSVDPALVSILVSPSAPVVGQAAHVRISQTTWTALAAGAGVSVDEYQATSEVRLEYSVGKSAENYTFAALPADHLGHKTAGQSMGRFGGHVYVTADTHTVRASIWRFGSKVAEGTRNITVNARTYTTANQGYLATTLPVAGSDGVPSGVTNLFTDINTAFAWVCGAAGRALYLRRGQTFTLTSTAAARNLPTNATVGAYDASGPNGTTGARPIVNTDFRYAGARITGTSTGSSQTITGSSVNANSLVYANNTLLSPSDYTLGTNSITLTRTAGQIIRVFNLTSNGRPQLGGGVVFRLGGGNNEGDPPATGQIIRDIDFVNGYDPVNPGSFDRNDLSTANAWVGTSFIQGGVGKYGNSTVFRCGVKGFLDGANVTLEGSVFGIVDVKFDGWANYPVFVSRTSRFMLIGCDIRQPIGTRNGLQGKFFNTPLDTVSTPLAALNAPWHGPMRLPFCFETPVIACRMDSRTSWAGDNPARAQPVVRFVQSARPGQSYVMSGCHTTGGQGCFGGGAKNGFDVQSKSGICTVGYNVLVSWPTKESFGTGAVRVQSVSNLYIVPAGAGATRDFQLFRSQASSAVLARANAPTDPWVSINDTVLLLDSRSSSFDLNPSYTVASPGIYCTISTVASYPAGTPNNAKPSRGTFVVPPEAVGTPTVRVPVNVSGLQAASGYILRIWRASNNVLLNMTSAPTKTAQAALYDFQYGAPDVSWALNEQPPAGNNNSKRAEWVDVTLKSGVWANGDHIRLSQELTEETAGFVELPDPDDGVSEDDIIPSPSIGTAETFVPNNRATALIRPPAIMHNTVLALAGTYGTVRIAGEVVDPAPYALAAWGGWDAYYRPTAGNTAIDSATGVRSAFDVRGQERVSPITRGALEPDSSLTDWPALQVQAPAVSIALSPATYSENSTFDASNVVVTVTTAGTPALSSGDVTKTAVVQSSVGVEISTTGSSDLEIGQRVLGRGTYSHILVPPQTIQTSAVSVPNPNFSPLWVWSNPDLAAAANTARNGGRVRYDGLTAPSASANQHVAFRFRNRHTAALGGVARLWSGDDGAGQEPRVTLTSTGELRVERWGTTTPFVLGTIPTDGGEASILLSSYRSGDNGGGLRCQIKIGSGTVQDITIPGPAKQLFSTEWRLFSTTQGVADVDYRQFVGTWTGGVPAFADVFETSGEVRDWAANPSLGVGLSQHGLLNGAGTTLLPGTFNGERDTGSPTPRLWQETQAVTFGDHTLAGFGGVPAPSGATGILGPGGYTLASGRVAPTSTGSATAGRMTFTGSDVVWDVTVQANRWDVRTHPELLETLARSELAYGDDVRLRAGAYDATQTWNSTTRIRRSTAINGTFTPPSDYGPPGTAGWYQGPNLDTGNYVRIRPDSGTVTYSGILYTDTGQIHVTGLRFSNLTFAANASMENYANNIATDGFTMLSADPPVVWDTGITPPAGLRDRLIFGVGTQNGKAINHTITEGLSGVRIFGTGASGHDVIGCRIRRMWADFIQTGANNSRFGWNILTDVRDPPIEGGSHPDAWQHVGPAENVWVYGNIATRGTPRNPTDARDFQGFFLAGSTYSNIQMVGNIYIGSHGQGLNVGVPNTNPLAAYNLVISHPDVFIDNAAIYYLTNVGNVGGRIYGNAADAYGIDAVAFEQNNVILNIANRATDFVNPDHSINPIDNLSGFVAGWAPKAGGALDATVTRGPIGRFNFIDRTFDPAILEAIDLDVSVSSGDTSITFNTTTDTGSGTIAWMVTNSAQTEDQTVAQGTAVAKGVATVTASGAQTPIVATGLTQGTSYHVSALQRSGARVSNYFASTISTTGTPPFVPRSASFNGSTRYASTSVSVPATNQGLMSVWIWQDTTWTSGRFVCNFSLSGATRFALQGQTSGRLTLSLAQDGTGSDLFTITPSPAMAADRWHHVLVSWNHDTDTLQVYVNDVAISTTGYSFSGSTKFEMAGENLNRMDIGAAAGSFHWVGDIGHLWLAFNQYLDLSVTANRRKFIDASGDPVDLGPDGSTPTGTAPQFYYDGDGSGWANQGTGPDVSLTGTLTAGTAPALP